MQVDPETLVRYLDRILPGQALWLCGSGFRDLFGFLLFLEIVDGGDGAHVLIAYLAGTIGVDYPTQSSSNLWGDARQDAPAFLLGANVNLIVRNDQWQSRPILPSLGRFSHSTRGLLIRAPVRLLLWSFRQPAGGVGRAGKLLRQVTVNGDAAVGATDPCWVPGMVGDGRPHCAA